MTRVGRTPVIERRDAHEHHAQGVKLENPARRRLLFSGGSCPKTVFRQDLSQKHRSRFVEIAALRDAEHGMRPATPTAVLRG